MTLYKLTTEDFYTTNSTLWGQGATHAVVDRVTNPQLCSRGVIHAHRNSTLALLLNPIHAGIDNPVLWEAEGTIVAEDWGKVGCYSLTTTKKLVLPEWYRDESIRARVSVLFATLCVESILGCEEEKYPDDDGPRNVLEAAVGRLKGATPSAPAWLVWTVAARSAWVGDPIDFAKLADKAVRTIMAGVTLKDGGKG